MNHYFFDLSDGTRERDELGTWLRDDGLAEVEAIRYAGEVLRHEPGRLAEGKMRVIVSNAERETLFCITVHLEECTAA